MRFLCIVVIAISLLVSGIFGLLTMSSNNKIADLEEEKAAMVERNNIYSTEISEIQTQIDTITVE